MPRRAARRQVRTETPAPTAPPRHARPFARRLGRPLADVEARAPHERPATLGPRRRSDATPDPGGDALARSFASPIRPDYGPSVFRPLVVVPEAAPPVDALVVGPEAVPLVDALVVGPEAVPLVDALVVGPEAVPLVDALGVTKGSAAPVGQRREGLSRPRRPAPRSGRE